MHRKIMSVTLATLSVSGNLTGTTLPKVIGVGGSGLVENRPIFSRNFSYCSALILDYGVGAVMVHALPVDKIDNESYLSQKVNTHTAVSHALALLHEQGIDTAEAEAIVFGGEDKGLETILRGLLNEDIKISRVYLARGSEWDSRDIWYNPVSDELKVTPHAFHDL